MVSLRHLGAILYLLIIPYVSAQDSIEIDNLLQTAEANVFANPTLANKLLDQAENYLTGNNNPSLEAHVLNLQGHLYILEGNYEKAYEKVIQAEELASKSGNKIQQAEAIRRQGIITSLLDLHGESLELLSKSLEIHQSLDSKYIQNNLQAIGNLYADSPQWADDLIETGELLVAEAVKRGNSHFEEQGYTFIVSGMIKKSQIAEAETVLQTVVKDPKNPPPMIGYYLAQTMLKLGDYEAALATIEKILQDSIEGNYKFRQLAASSLKSEILLAVNNIEEAKTSLNWSLNLAQELSFGKFQIESLQGLANIAFKEQNYKLAFDLQKQYSEIQQRVFDTRQSEQLAFNRARLETEQKIQQITELQLNQKLASQQNRFQISIIATAVAIATLLLILFVRTTQQKRTLRVLADNLKQATDAKSDFLARMSHEIRTPINAIVGLTKLTQRSELNQEQETNLSQIEQSSQTLLSVINDILDFSKIEAGKLDIETAPFELDKLVEQAIDLHALKAREKRIELIQYVARDVPLHIEGDAFRIQQVLNNLLSNALKFTEQGLISVSVNKKYSEQGVLLEFSVKDTGIGLSEEQIETLFDAFTQADESITRKYGGTGLGLSICQNLVSLMGGEIWVESKPRQGATFYFTVLVDAYQQLEENAVADGLNLSDLKVLVVDDVVLSRQAIAEALLRIGINPDLASGSNDALLSMRRAALENAPYDLVILDWKMADVNGIELAAIINQEFTLNKPKIIMLSAFDIQSLKELGQPLGIKHYLQKPINSSSLLNCLLSATKQSQSSLIKSENVAPETPDFSNVHILLVEDDEINRKVARFFLADTHAKISVAENGLIALQMLAGSHQYDLVLMDMQMPIMDGLTATQKTREELKLDIPIVAMTAHALQTEIEKSFAVGVNAHLIKPVQAAHLYQVIQEQLDGRNEVKLLSPNTLQMPTENEQSALLTVDREKAIKLFNDDEKVYAVMVKTFVDMHDEVKNLAKALEKQDLNAIAATVHSFNSAVAYIGAYHLMAEAAQIERAAKDPQNNNLEAVLARAERFKQLILELVKKLSAE
ncbi:response regulator [Aliiglaciecola sp. M165]|uniref:response regulator n=1 Tax=Aliiglaciecola sp. M165 TaxID=2593649 RepID=UPI001180875B|nr:response regulator [Aliiglaciecola sp. M165]TRY33145.1 response regulator [Aliiglaciecola sp. M165]